MDTPAICGSAGDLAALCSQVGKTLKGFASGAAEIDAEILELGTEIWSIHGISKQIESFLREERSEVLPVTGHEGEHWMALKRVMDSSGETIKSVESHLLQLTDTKNINLVSRIKAQWKKNAFRERTNLYRMKIRNDKDALQISLQLLIISSTENKGQTTTFTVPGLDEVLSLVKLTYERISVEQSSSDIRAQESVQSPVDSHVSSLAATLSDEPGESIDQSQEDLSYMFSAVPSLQCIRSAGRVLSTASTVLRNEPHEESGSIHMPPDHSETERIDGWIRHVKSDEPKSTEFYKRLFSFDHLYIRDLNFDSLEEEDQCDLFIKQFKLDFPDTYKESIRFVRALSYKSMALRARDLVDDADAWMEFADKLASQIISKVPEKDIKAQYWTFACGHSHAKNDFSLSIYLLFDYLEAEIWNAVGEKLDIASLKIPRIFPNPIKLYGSATFSPLHILAVAGWAYGGEHLIESGIKVDTRDADGRTPLQIATSYNNGVFMSMLIAKGAYSKQRNKAD